MSASTGWPAVAGTYQVGDPQGPVAVCVLTSEDLMAPLARLPGVALSGKVYTANLGIARIVVNVTANPAIRFLLLCGKDSPLFHPGQSLVALAEAGLDDERRIVGAVGYEPVLPEHTVDLIPRFRRQVEIVDWTGEEDLAALEEGVGGLVARSPGQFATDGDLAGMPAYGEQFREIRPGGQREPLQYDPKGYFVITLDREKEQIVLRHYLPDHTPAHEMRGRMAGSMFLGLLREGLVSQLSHAGYLGEELAKAQAALLLGLRYDQDRPLRHRETPAQAQPAEVQASAPGGQAQGQGQGQDAAPANAAPAMPSMSQVAPPQTWAEVQASAPGAAMNIVLSVAELPEADLLAGTFLAADEAEPFSVYRRTPHQFRIRWTPATQFAMGGADDLRVGAVVRARGALAEGGIVEAERLVILTEVARVIEE